MLSLFKPYHHIKGVLYDLYNNASGAKYHGAFTITQATDTQLCVNILLMKQSQKDILIFFKYILYIMFIVFCFGFLTSNKNVQKLFK